MSRVFITEMGGSARWLGCEVRRSRPAPAGGGGTSLRLVLRRLACFRARVVAVVGVGVVLLVGCTSQTDATSTSPTTSPASVAAAISSGPFGGPAWASAAPGPSFTWTPRRLPAGVTASTLTPSGERLLVGGVAAVAGPDTTSPRMYVLDTAGNATPVPLTPVSPYAFLAQWYSVVSDGARIVAIGGARGGAHGNVRWSTWAGTTAGVREQTQNFLTFGGEDAGQLLDAVLTPEGPVLVGTWASAKTGQDAVIWLQDKTIWRRQSSAGTPLESIATVLVGPRAAVSSGAGVLVVGSAVHLGPGSVTQTAAVWRSSGPDGGWHPIDLPSAGKTSEAVSARCQGMACLVAGRVDDTVALWEVNGDDAHRLTGIPAAVVTDQDNLPPPLSRAGHDVVVAPGGDHALVLTRTEHGWQVSAGPPGSPVAAAVVGSYLWVIAVPRSGSPATLWQSSS